jgi:hypothetical protein
VSLRLADSATGGANSVAPDSEAAGRSAGGCDDAGAFPGAVFVGAVPAGGVEGEAVLSPVTLVRCDVAAEAEFAEPKASPLCFAHNRAAKQTTIQIDAVMIVIRVNTSPAFAPNALEPPMPPSAPANPPPRPRCTSTNKIKKTASSESTMANNGPMVGYQSVMKDKLAGREQKWSRGGVE